MDRAKVVTGLRGAEHLLYQGFSYTKRRAGGVTVVNWRCSSYFRFKCNAVVKTGPYPYENPTVWGEHSHPPNHANEEVLQMRLSAREAALSSEEIPVNIVSSALTKLSDNAKEALGSIEAIKRDLRRKRMETFPPVHGNVEDLESARAWTTTGGSQLTDFQMHVCGQQEKDRGVPEGGKVNADHNHSRIAVEQEATVVLREIRERCLRELTKRPILIIRETLATCSQEVRDYLNIGAIRQDMRRMRSSAAGRELLKKPKHPIKRARMEASSLDPMTPLGDQTPFNPHGAGTGSELDPNSRVEDTDHHSNQDTSTVKDELILDDYEDSEHTYYDESESSKSASEDNLACPSTSKDFSDPFETVICDSEVQQFQVKQEFVEEESSNFEAIQDTCSVPSTAMSTDVCSTVPTKVQPPCRPTSFADKMRLNSLNTLTRMPNTLDHPTISTQNINSLRYSVPCQPPVMPYNYEYNFAENSSASNYSKFYSTSTSVTNPTNLPSARSTSISGVSVPNVSATSATNSPVASARNLNSVTSTNLLKENCSVNHYSKFYSRPTSVTNPADIYTNFQGVSATNPPATTSTDVPFTNPTNLPADSSTNLPVNVAVASASPPGQPPRDEDSSCIYDREDLEGVFISLKKVPKERRKKTKDKLLRLVKLITELGLDPDEVSFSVTTK